MTGPRADPSARPPAEAGAFRAALTLFHVRGVPIRAHVSWLLLAGLVTWLFFARFSGLLADLGPAVVGGAAVVAALLFFASLLAHELGHALTSLQRDIPVVGVTLFLLGGVTESTREARSAKDDFVIVATGPFVSLVLAAAFGLLHTAVVDLRVPAAVTGYLAWTNLLLAVFNVVPAYPLDGGRLLRALIWWVVRRPHQATRWAARVGQAFAFALGGLGLWLFVGAAGRGLRGVWEVMIALFLYRGAADSHRRARLRERLADRNARQAMGSAPPPLPADLPLSDAVVRLQERPSLLWPVGHPPLGGLTLADIDAVPRGRWALTSVADAARPREQVSVDADTPMDEVLDRILRAPGNMLLVTEGDDVVGLLTPSLVSHLTA